MLRFGQRGRCDSRLRVMCRTGVKRRGLDPANLIATQYGGGPGRLGDVTPQAGQDLPAQHQVDQ
jgi:hypothetical protein